MMCEVPGIVANLAILLPLVLSNLVLHNFGLWLLNLRHRADEVYLRVQIRDH
jgi:hypothetical protein